VTPGHGIPGRRIRDYSIGSIRRINRVNPANQSVNPANTQ